MNKNNSIFIEAEEFEYCVKSIIFPKTIRVEIDEAGNITYASICEISMPELRDLTPREIAEVAEKPAVKALIASKLQEM